MHARSALFDLYGDHLLSRGGSAPVAALIRLLDPLGLRPPAVRTAVSRMVAQGWLVPDDGGYRVTDRARVRLDEASARIYRTRTEPWDGHWHVRVLAPVADRSRRERVRTQLRFLGLASISDSTWVSPRVSAEADTLLLEESIDVVALSTTDAEPPGVLLDAFDIGGLATSYRDWLRAAQQQVAPADDVGDDRTSFVVRSELLHSWRMFLFTDPGLPQELLPVDWPGHQAAAFFDEHADRLLPAASRFVDQCLTPTGDSS